MPSLAEGDIYAEGADLGILLKEVEIVVANLELFTEDAESTVETLRLRVVNILTAVERAISTGRGVVIW